MQYGKSEHYEGEKGKAYFAYQNKDATIGAQLNKSKFENYIKPTDTVLDFGCGGGWLLAALDCTKKVGVELNENAHNFCKENGIKVFKSIDSVVDNDFDVIISHHCLEHVPYPIEALSSLHKKLKGDGLFVLVVPIDDWRVQRDYTGNDIDHHLYTWTPRLLANTLVEAGYEIDKIEVLTHAWFPRWNVLFGKIPQFAFDTICTFWSILLKRRQLLAVARKSNKVSAPVH